MRHIQRFVCVLLLFLGGVFIFPQEREFAWKQAQDLYAKGQFAEALALFETVARTSDHWRIQFNIGNCLLKLDRNLEAKLAFLRVWQFNPGLPSLRRNLSVVNARLGVGDEVLTEMVWQKIFNRLSQHFSPGFSGLILLSAVLLFNLSLFFWGRKVHKRLARYGAGLGLVLALVFGTHILYVRSIHNNHDMAVVISDKASLFSGPGESHTALFSIPVGLSVRIEEKSKGWWRVRAGAEVSGWIRPNGLKEI